MELILETTESSGAFGINTKTEQKTIGRIEFELFSDCPLTSENFRCLCTGEKGIGKSGKPLHYKGNVIHRIVPNFMMQGGDITDQDGTGGESIYGYHFNDENYIHKHDSPYVLAMANCGNKNTNGSQFYITTMKCNWLDEENVVFGRVVRGQDIIKELDEYIRERA